mgnify:CR=1 FL=1
MQSEQQGQNLKIHAYDFADMLQQLQEAVLQGYRLDYSNNATYPFATMGQYWVVLVPEANLTKTEKTVQEEVVVEVQHEEKVETTRKARKSKSE